MRFPRWTKICFDAKVNLNITACKPASAALGQFRRLGNFFHPELACIECPRYFLFSGRHCKLDVIYSGE